MLQLRFVPGWVPRNGFFGLKETIGTVHKRFYALASEQPSRKTVKPLDSRKTFLIDTYKHLMENSSMIFLSITIIFPKQKITISDSRLNRREGNSQK